MGAFLWKAESLQGRSQQLKTWINVKLHFKVSEVKLLSCVRPSATPWTATFQAPPSMGFSRQDCWSGVPLSSPNYISRPSINISEHQALQTCSQLWGQPLLWHRIYAFKSYLTRKEDCRDQTGHCLHARNLEHNKTWLPPLPSPATTTTGLRQYNEMC